MIRHNQTSDLTHKNIKFNFISPRAPNFDGLWDRLIRSVKLRFKRIVLNSLLMYEEASTLLMQIEAIINSRPLTPLSDDPSSFHAFTLFDFLVPEILMDMTSEVFLRTGLTMTKDTAT